MILGAELFNHSIFVIEATALERAGALVALIGVYLLVTHSRFSRYGWIIIFVVNFSITIPFLLYVSN